MSTQHLQSSPDGDSVDACAFNAALSVTTAPPEPRWTPANRRVLLIGIDGCRMDSIERIETPSIDRLIASGHFFGWTDICPPGDAQISDTVSGPGWTSILTGTWADAHCVKGNVFWWKQQPVPDFLSRIEAVNPEAATCAFVSWSPFRDNILQSPDELFCIDGTTAGCAAADAELVRACIHRLDHGEATAVFLYLSEMDEAGHRFGFHPIVPQYASALKTIDQQIGEVMGAVERRVARLEEDWLVVITTDHGGQGLHHSQGWTDPDVRHVFTITTCIGQTVSYTDRESHLVDVCPTLLSFLGISANSEHGRTAGSSLLLDTPAESILDIGHSPNVADHDRPSTATSNHRVAD